MSTIAFIRAAAGFAAGAVVGGGLTAITTNRMHSPPESLPPAPVTVDQTISHPLSVEQQRGLNAASLKYGFPLGPSSNVLIRQGYVAGYDRRLRHPAWTAEHLTKERLAVNNANRKKSRFAEDIDIPDLFRAKEEYYRESGYDRGHMVPAADVKTSQPAMNETFLLSNIAPQVAEKFNRHYWAYLEEWCRKLTTNFADVYVFTVPVYRPKKDSDGKWRVTHEVIGGSYGVAVPTHFAKVVLTSKPSSSSDPNIPEISTGAFILPNDRIADETPLSNFSVDVKEVERLTGLQFFNENIRTSSKGICETVNCGQIKNSGKRTIKVVDAPEGQA